MIMIMIRIGIQIIVIMMKIGIVKIGIQMTMMTNKS